ncbi:MAG: RNA polymerase sigma-54 factor [Alcanivorax borkumensis]|jgi:RNA polymerase sigma-54 factor|nr:MULTISPECIES: RNA polymerase factor sigma-54 [Alcanivorax]EUC70084.1 RNA polymerase factor sigma-54 [Alcanivorax sp. 97CO-5]OJH08011.1 MAG: RNA polymerase sigma-54 factor [Alcanivorax borkumensis]PKG01867.1 RNA polymerase sigma-54 factor [Alcanivorax sp. 97CO-6]BAP13420.1 RNA polymerase sigma-54 factor [Alcanivorax sp. NBRC 101098]
MKPTLQLQIGQQLTMTPQLQQAIRLLQLSTLDLRQEIQQAVESNPLLELADDFGDDALPEHDEERQDEELDTDRDNALEELIQDEPEVETEWDDVYSGQSTSNSAALPDDADEWQQRHAVSGNLQDHLLWQLNLTPMSDVDRIIAITIIESLDDRGYITAPLSDIVDMVNAQPDLLTEGDELEHDEVLAVQHRLQQFDPVGVASVNLADCLGVQLRQLPADTPLRDEASALLEHLNLLEKHDYTALRRTLQLSEEVLLEALSLLRTLDPAPGEQIGEPQVDYAVPDVIVRQHQGRWQVSLNDDVLPRVNLQQQYASIARTTSGEDGQYLRNCVQEAKWFIKSLQSRHDTLLKVATRIVDVQQGFFDYGDEAMKPLVLADIADAVEMHESTISRVTNQKYMMTPRGVFELKYFFSSHVGTDGGGECSSTAIRAIIKKLVAAENPRKPLSDNKLASLLNEQGINVARRTVAKYREAMRIPSSSARKRLV